MFEGFLPRSGRARSDRLAELATEPRTIVLYEAPHRVARTLADLAAAFGADRRVSIARELTKLYETVVSGTLGSIDLGEPRGEYVLVVAGAPRWRGADRRRRPCRPARRAGRRRASSHATPPPPSPGGSASPSVWRTTCPAVSMPGATGPALP